jgi:hypothetical protein
LRYLATVVGGGRQRVTALHQIGEDLLDLVQPHGPFVPELTDEL